MNHEISERTAVVGNPTRRRAPRRGAGGGSDDGRDGPPAVPHGLDLATRTVITVGSSLAGELVHGWIAPDRLLTDVTAIAVALTSTVFRARVHAAEVVL